MIPWNTANFPSPAASSIHVDERGEVYVYDGSTWRRTAATVKLFTQIKLTLYNFPTSDSGALYTRCREAFLPVLWPEQYSKLWCELKVVGSNGVIRKTDYQAKITYGQLWDWMLANIQIEDEAFKENLIINIYEVISDKSPGLVRCINSIYSSMRGRKKYYAKGYTGIDSGFVTHFSRPNLFSNLYSFVYGVNPSSNNNDAIWYPVGRAVYNYPKIGSNVVPFNNRLVYNASTGSYEESSSVMTVGNPIFLCEFVHGSGILDLCQVNDVSLIRGNWIIKQVSGVICFPLTRQNPNLRAFFIKPFGIDHIYVPALQAGETLVAEAIYRKGSNRKVRRQVVSTIPQNRFGNEVTAAWAYNAFFINSRKNYDSLVYFPEEVRFFVVYANGMRSQYYKGGIYFARRHCNMPVALLPKPYDT